MTIRIVTDSTADLPQEVAQRLGITVVPLNVTFGTQVYQDGVDIQAEEFYKRLESAKALPTTSQPAVGAFLECYRRLASQGQPVVSIHVSAKVSGTYNSALQAKAEAGRQIPIEVVDSRMVSMSLGLIATKAAEVAASGAGLKEVMEAAHRAIEQSRLYFTLDTLEYLQKGGRIGRAQAFLGSVLNIKPLLELREGEVMPLERARSRARALERLIGLVEAVGPLDSLAVGYSTTSEEAQGLSQRLAHAVSPKRLQVIRIGPVVGTYAGPGCVGVGLIRSD